MLNRESSEVSICELGQLYYEKGELLLAKPLLEEARVYFFAQKKIRRYFDVTYKLLRLHIELDQQDGILKIKEELKELMISEDIEMSSKLYYTLGVCSELEGRREESYRFFEKALSVALTESNKEEICYALCGKAIWYKNGQDYEKAFALIENLKLFFETITLPEVATSVGILESMIYLKLGKLDDSLKALWAAYAESRKARSVFFMNSYVLIQFSIVYMKLGKHEMAREYFELARKSIKEGEHIRTQQILKDAEKALQETEAESPDIIIRTKDHSVFEISKGQIPLNNQFILLDLLVEFVNKKGSALTKEDLAQLVWGQNYDPQQHDNKIYVTIRRLRRLLEPDPRKPQYILRVKDGYLLNPNSQVVVME